MDAHDSESSLRGIYKESGQLSASLREPNFWWIATSAILPATAATCPSDCFNSKFRYGTARDWHASTRLRFQRSSKPSRKWVSGDVCCALSLADHARHLITPTSLISSVEMARSHFRLNTGAFSPSLGLGQYKADETGFCTRKLTCLCRYVAGSSWPDPKSSCLRSLGWLQTHRLCLCLR
jgi:hypothetical protein